jgi:hypothetical protein
MRRCWRSSSCQGPYRYRGVSQDVFEDLRQAPSKGAFFNVRIKDAYPFEQVV